MPILRAAAAAWMDDPVLLEVSLDGISLQNLNAYRAKSPAPFNITFPENALFEIPTGTYDPHVSDGYWLMLAPLSAGTHTIHTKVISNDTLGFVGEETTNLIVGQ